MDALRHCLWNQMHKMAGSPGCCCGVAMLNHINGKKKLSTKSSDNPPIFPTSSPPLIICAQSLIMWDLWRFYYLSKTRRGFPVRLATITTKKVLPIQSSPAAVSESDREQAELKAIGQNNNLYQPVVTKQHHLLSSHVQLPMNNMQVHS